MDEIEQGELNSTNEEELLQEAPEEEAPPPKKEYTPEQKLARVERLRAKYMKELGISDEPKKDEPAKVNPGELDKADYAILVAKGIEEKEEVDFVHKQMLKWDMSLTEVLRDEDVQAKLKGMRIEREVREAMPSSTKRAGNGNITNLDYWIAKYDKTGELPDDFELRSAVVNAKYESVSKNTPPWRQ